MANDEKTKIPNLPPFYNMKMTNKDGNLTSEGNLYFDQTYQVLNDMLVVINNLMNATIQNKNVTLDGLIIPSKTTVEITAYATDDNFPVGTIWHDSDLHKLKFKATSSTIETITST